MVLDNSRLRKQRVEAYQLLQVNLNLTTAWINHPAALMWWGFEPALALYGITACQIWKQRGYLDTVEFKIRKLIEPCPVWPRWIGDERVHRSHRAALLRKDYKHYSQFGWKEKPAIDYYWPC